MLTIKTHKMLRASAMNGREWKLPRYSGQTPNTTSLLNVSLIYGTQTWYSLSLGVTAGIACFTFTSNVFLSIVRRYKCTHLPTDAQHIRVLPQDQEKPLAGQTRTIQLSIVTPAILLRCSQAKYKISSLSPAIANNSSETDCLQTWSFHAALVATALETLSSVLHETLIHSESHFMLVASIPSHKLHLQIYAIILLS